MSELRHPDRWEQGSEHSLIDALAGGAGEMVDPWHAARAAPSFYGSGRDAMRAILSHGREALGWRRLLVPSYFCQEVVRALMAVGLEVMSYPDDPRDPQIDLESLASRVGPGAAVLVSNTFGLRGSVDAEVIRAKGAAVIEDHTHDPWSRWAHGSTADYALASLRKTLPIPDGGVLWSPRGHVVPSSPRATPERERASGRKLGAMWMKRLYLAGQAVEKEAYRALFAAGEAEIASGPISGMADATLGLLRAFPVSAWRAIRRANYDHLRRAISGTPGIDVLSPVEADACPFSVVCVLPSRARRDHVRARLSSSRIYAAVLWPFDDLALSDVPGRAVDLGGRSLSLHCDMRYGADDLDRVATVLRDAAKELTP